MKTKAIVATLLIAAAASADARFAPPYPRKPLPPDEIGHWIVINSTPWSHDVKSKPATSALDRLAVARQVRPVADRTGEKPPPTEEKFRTSGKRFHVL
jgi:hypothetical protein